jgi:hypothetical protein
MGLAHPVGDAERYADDREIGVDCREIADQRSAQKGRVRCFGRLDQHPCQAILFEAGDKTRALISREMSALRRTKWGKARSTARTEKRSALSNGPEILEVF